MCAGGGLISCTARRRQRGVVRSRADPQSQRQLQSSLLQPASQAHVSPLPDRLLTRARVTGESPPLVHPSGEPAAANPRASHCSHPCLRGHALRRPRHPSSPPPTQPAQPSFRLSALNPDTAAIASHRTRPDTELKRRSVPSYMGHAPREGTDLRPPPYGCLSAAHRFGRRWRAPRSGALPDWEGKA